MEQTEIAKENRFKVELTYFKLGGKHYSTGEYETDKEFLFEIFTEVQRKLDDGDLPGLTKGSRKYFVLVDVPTHPHYHRHLCMPSKIEDVIQTHEDMALLLRTGSDEDYFGV